MATLTGFRVVCVVILTLLVACLIFNNYSLYSSCPTISSTILSTISSQPKMEETYHRQLTSLNRLLTAAQEKLSVAEQALSNSRSAASDEKNIKQAINFQDVLDMPVSNSKQELFPKPAPPLYLSMDNNALGIDDRLQENLFKPNVHFVWCGKRWFEFRMYLALVSVIRALQPDKAVFYYEHYPPIDSNRYNLWLDDLKHDYQFFEVVQMKGETQRLCHSDRENKLTAIGELLGETGGVYISESTWMLEFPGDKRNADVLNALDEELNGYLMLRGGLVNQETTLPEILAKQSYNITKASCSSVHHMYHSASLDAHCLIVRGGKFETIYPMDFAYVEDDPFAKVVRKLFYGFDEIRKPTPNFNTLVPNIGHMIWIGGGKMDYVFFLSILSMLYVVRVDVLYIHGDTPPTGPNWQRLCELEHIRKRIKLVSRDPPSKVYQGVIEPWYRALMSDIIRVDLMIKYGGVYTDTDAIWVKPLSMEERGYDAVATYDWVDWSYPYPDTVNFGVSYGKRNAPFYRLFRDSMRFLDNELHGFTGVAMPYKILEKHPGLLQIDRRLGVICYFSRCHPLWVKDYHNMTHDHVVAKSIPNWREDVHAFHWTHPNPTELHNETVLMHSEGIFAELGRYVLEKAGLLKV